MTFSLLSQSFKMYEEDKAAADCLHRDTMTVSWENVFISVPNGYASWAKPLNKENARNRKNIHYSVQFVAICVGLVCDKWFSTVFRNVREIDFFRFAYFARFRAYLSSQPGLNDTKEQPISLNIGKWIFCLALEPNLVKKKKVFIWESFLYHLTDNC